MHASFGQTLSLALGAGALVSLLCTRLRVPAILPLLATGIALGRSGSHVVDAGALGSGLQGIITVTVALLVFEGGLHLRRQELAHAPRAVIGLLTIGALVTWSGAAVLGRYLLGFDWVIAALLGAMLIVTGPTVIQPILRRLSLTPALHTALGAEAILIDPIGVIASIVCLEAALLYASDAGGLSAAAFAWDMVTPFAWGIGIGGVSAALAWGGLRLISAGSRAQPAHLNLLAIAACMVSAGAGEAAAPEAGLVATTFCAVILANARVLGVAEMRAFKEQLSTLAVGALFILIGSTVDLERIRAIGAVDVVFVLALLLVVRPLNVLLSTGGSKLSKREKLYAALLSPRGVVAASMASIAATQLAELGATGARGASLAEQAARAETIVLLVILVSVAGTSLFAKRLSTALGVNAAARAAIIVGAHPLGVAAARALVGAGVKPVLIDTNERRVERAAVMGFVAIEADATDLRHLDDIAHEHAAGAVIAWTGNSDVDRIIGRWALDRFPAARVLEGMPADRLPRDVAPGWSPLHTAIDMVADGVAHVVFATPEEGDAPLLTLADQRPAAQHTAPSPPAESVPAPGPIPEKPSNGKQSERPSAPPTTLVLRKGPEPPPAMPPAGK